MLSSLFSAVIAVSFLSIPISVSGLPLRGLQTRAAGISPSFATLSKPIIAPYYLYFGNSATASLTDAYDQIGLRAATVAFITAIPGTCKPTADLDNMEADVSAYVAKGGVVNLSFGGAIGISATHAHVQDACTDVNQLADLIKSSLQRFKTHNAEFDIEDPALLANTAATQRLASALAIVKKSIPDLHLTYTLATMPTGMPEPQLEQVQAAKDAGVTIDILALMTMDMVLTDVEPSSEASILAGAKQFETVYGLAAGTGIKRMGVIPMIGRDDQGAQFSVSDAANLAVFASQKSLAYLTFWNLNRDFSGLSDLSRSSGAPDQTSPYQFFEAMKSALGSNQRSDDSAVGATIAVLSPMSQSRSSTTSSSSSASQSFPAKSATAVSPAGPTSTSIVNEVWVTVTVTATATGPDATNYA